VRVFVIAGEASGDRLGAALMQGLRRLRPEVAFEGIGGAQMTAQGLTSRFDMSELSLMGLAEILPRYRALKRRIAQTAKAVLAMRPEVLVTIDSPDFCLRVARMVRAANPAIRIVHYVAPSVWAWRPGRARRMAGLVDQVLALLPFEPPYLHAHGIACDFVGHPVVAEPVATPDEVAAFRAAHGLGAQVLCVLPGSRPASAGARRAGDGRAAGPADFHLAGQAGDCRLRCRLQQIGDVSGQPRGAGRLGHRVAGTGRGRDADGHRL
jgi:lipid-A-disaccharide synthase